MKIFIYMIIFLSALNLFPLIINIPDDFVTIQAGIYAAVDGDTVLVEPDTYFENINYGGKNITVASLFLTTLDSVYISQTIIDGNQNGSVVTFMANEDSTAVLTGFTIRNGENFRGGGILCIDASPTLNNCIITENLAYFWDGPAGGGIYCENSYMKITDVEIIGNYSNSFNFTESGGGVSCANSTPIFTNVLITDNYCGSNHGYGGGLCLSGSEAYFYNVYIADNQAGGGGGLASWGSSVNLINSELYANVAVAYGGGGIYCINSELNITHCFISSNISKGPYYSNGGGIFSENSTFNMTATFIKYNYANNLGGGIYWGGDCDITFDPENRCSIYLNHAGLEGNDLYSTGTTPVDVIIDTFTVQTPDDYFSYPLQNYNFDILNSVITRVNQDLYVSPDGSDDNSGITEEEPLKTISRALAKVISDSLCIHSIFLDNGFYSPDETGELFPLHMKSYISLEGNSADATVLDGCQFSGLISLYNHHNVKISNLSLQNGLTAYGGGIYSLNSSAEIDNIKVENNNLYNPHGTDTWGAGIYCNNSIINLSNSAIRNNQGLSSNGGGIYLEYTDMFLCNDIISDNQGSIGGGIYCFASDPIIINTIITGNAGGLGGAGILCYTSRPHLIDTICWENNIEFFWVGMSVITISFSDIQGGEAGIITNDNGTVYWLDGNLNEDPLFAGTGEDPYCLLEESPCIDTGIPDTTGLNLPPCDIMGNQRIWDGDGDGIAIIDMGAYEYGSPPYVAVEENVIIQIPGIILHQNFPNPFNPETAIKYQLAEVSNVDLSIFNIKGQLVKKLVDEVKTAGEHAVVWNGRDDNNKSVISGIYLYRLKVGNDLQVRKMVLLK